MTAGQFLLKFYHTPVGRMRDSWRNGGPLAERKTERQRLEMVAAAATLPPLPTPAADTPLCLHLLTGRRFWYQTAFCLRSFTLAAGEPVRAEIYDDGTIDATTAGLLQRLGPAIRIHAQEDFLARRDRLLPAARYPTLRERWLNYPNLRKMIDPHLGSTGWKLVIDSDLLFFKRPAVVLDWLRASDRPFHAVDCTESYGYSRPLMERLAGAPIPPLVNVGLCGLRSEALDWDELEEWCADLIAREKTSYYLEQALVAMLAARQPCAVAPAADYVTKPEKWEAIMPKAAMHHYVDTSKRWYFRHCWRRFAPR
jgi:hypothetical protein